MSSEPGGRAVAGGRIAMADEGTMSARQREVYDRIVSGKRGRIVGPLRVALHSPELADRWQALGEFLRFDTGLPRELSELAIAMTGRYWNCQLEWAIHSRIAVEAGLSADIIESIRTAQPPQLDGASQVAVYEFTRELLGFGHVSDDVYAKLIDAVDVVAAVELTAIIGYYSMVAMTLNAHDVPLPADEDGPRLELPESDGPPEPTRLPSTLAGESARE